MPAIPRQFLDVAAAYDKTRKVVEDGSDPLCVGSYGVRHFDLLLIFVINRRALYSVGPSKGIFDLVRRGTD